MRTEVHPINGFTYEELGDGLVKVTTKSGAYGIFDWEGHWKEGSVTHADPHLTNYVGGPNLPEGMDLPMGRAGLRTLQRTGEAKDGDAAAAAYGGSLAGEKSDGESATDAYAGPLPDPRD